MGRLKKICSNKRKRLAFLTLVISVLTVFFVSFLSLTSSPLFCTRVCHSMQEVKKGWKVSPHSKIACVNCHVESNGVLAFVLHKMSAYKEPYFEITGKYKEGINPHSELAEEMPEEHCTVCHSEKRVVTPPEGLKFSTEQHEDHQKLDLQCAFCHNRVGHETKDHENHLSMEWCLEECHSKESFKTECTACHTEEWIRKANPEQLKKGQLMIEESKTKREKESTEKH